MARRRRKRVKGKKRMDEQTEGKKMRGTGAEERDNRKAES